MEQKAPLKSLVSLLSLQSLLDLDGNDGDKGQEDQDEHKNNTWWKHCGWIIFVGLKEKEKKVSKSLRPESPCIYRERLRDFFFPLVLIPRFFSSIVIIWLTISGVKTGLGRGNNKNGNSGDMCVQSSGLSRDSLTFFPQIFRSDAEKVEMVVDD